MAERVRELTLKIRIRESADDDAAEVSDDALRDAFDFLFNPHYDDLWSSWAAEAVCRALDELVGNAFHRAAGGRGGERDIDLGTGRHGVLPAGVDADVRTLAADADA